MLTCSLIRSRTSDQIGRTIDLISPIVEDIRAHGQSFKAVRRMALSLRDSVGVTKP